MRPCHGQGRRTAVPPLPLGPASSLLCYPPEPWWLSSHERIFLSSNVRLNSRSGRPAVLAQPASDGTLLAIKVFGGVVEWFMAPVLKTGRPKGLVSSNLTPSATRGGRTVSCARHFFARSDNEDENAVRLAERSSARVKIPQLRDLTPKPKRSFG